MNRVKESSQKEILECDTNLDFRDPKIYHAQFEINQVNVHTSRNISDSKVQLIKEFEWDYEDMDYGV